MLCLKPSRVCGSFTKTSDFKKHLRKTSSWDIVRYTHKSYGKSWKTSALRNPLLCRPTVQHYLPPLREQCCKASTLQIINCDSILIDQKNKSPTFKRSTLHMIDIYYLLLGWSFSINFSRTKLSVLYYKHHSYFDLNLIKKSSLYSKASEHFLTRHGTMSCIHWNIYNIFFLLNNF